jgi:integrase
MKANIILHSRENANNEHPLKIRLSEGKRKYFIPIKSGSTSVSIPKSKWNEEKQQLKVVRPSQSQEYKDYLNLRNLLNSILSNYETMISSLAKEGRSVTFEQLVRMVENPVKIVTVFDYFKLLVNRFKTANKLGQARCYNQTLDSIKKFEPTDFKFSDIDLHFLKRYEDQLRQNGLKDTSISVYFRTFRAVYNNAIGEGFARQTDYPFGKRSDNTTFTVSKFDDKTQKRAISKDQIKQIEELKTIGGKPLTALQEFSKQIFLFSYFTAGINFNDIAKLKWNDFDGIRINYVRTKTHTKISTFLLPYSKRTIQNLRIQTGIDQDNYIFTILNKHIHVTPQQIGNRIHKVLGQVNKALKEITKEAKIKEIVSTYTARHSFITHAAQSGEITPFDLQKMVGHKDISTTMIYYQDSNQEKKDLLMQKIIGL